MGDVDSKKLDLSQRAIETETHIDWNRTGEPAWLETFDAAVARKWTRAGIAVQAVGPGCWRARVPVEDLRISLKKSRAPMSEAQRAVAAERLKAARERRA